MADTRNDIVDLADKLIRTQGYNGFSYKDISSVLNIKNAAIHYHFPSKTNLGVAVIQRNREGFRELVDIMNRETDVHKKLNQFIDIYTRSQKNGLVCFMGALGPSYDNLPAEMQCELSLASTEIRNGLTDILEEGKKLNKFSFNGSAKAQADIVIASLLASLILNKVTGENVLKSTIGQLLKNI